METIKTMNDLSVKEPSPTADIGVVIGRMQIHELHQAHRDLIQFVVNKHDRVILFLGLAAIRNTITNPLNFRDRKQMINEVFPNVEVFYVDDQRSDADWSKTLDAQIRKHLTPSQTCILYGSRDSFIRRYSGKNKTIELDSKVFVSGTEIRRQVANGFVPNKDYRAGKIAATYERYPVAYQTVDVAILNKEKNELLLVRKPDEKLWRFVGGFSDPNSPSLEADAKRETMEETGVEVANIRYLSSMKINDWRYRGTECCIKTAFFAADYVFGNPQGADDVAEAKWFSYSEIKPELVMEEHRPLLERLALEWGGVK